MLTEQEIQQFTDLAKKFESQNADAVHGIIQTHMHAVFQRINDGGRSAANADNKAKLEQLDNKVKAFDTEKAALVQQIKDLTEKTPDVAALRREYEQKITEIEGKAKLAVEEKDQLLVKTHRDRVTAEFIDHLVGDDLKVDRDYAKEVLARRDDVLKRIRVKTDGSYDVLQAGQQELTITPASGKTAVRHLAEELAATVPEKFKVSGVVGRGPRPAGAPGSTGEGSIKFDQIRAAEKERAASSGNLVPRPGLARLSGKPVTVAE